MKELKLRGFVTAQDCGGNVQQAVDLAAELGLNKVVLTGEVSLSQPVTLPGGMYLVLKNAWVKAQGAAFVTKIEENYSFRTQFLTLEGSNSHICGDIHIFNTHHVNISGLHIDGTLTFEYCVWGRVENMRFSSGGLIVGRGCSNFIVQDLESDVPAAISGGVSCGKIVPGSKPDLNNIILQDSAFTGDGVYLGAAEDCGVMNVQVDHIRAGGAAVTVGQGAQLPEELFFNLTLTDLQGDVVYRNRAKHVYQK